MSRFIGAPDEQANRVHLPLKRCVPLVSYQWPGNIRELQNFIERSVIITFRGTLWNLLSASLGRMPPKCTRWGAITLGRRRARIIFARLFEQNPMGGLPARMGRPARLGLKRSTLYFRMQKLGILAHQQGIPFRHRRVGNHSRNLRQIWTHAYDETRG